jgi:dCTP diphosphatase
MDDSYWKGIKMEELMQEILEFSRERDWEQFHTPENLAKSISIEAGELLECFQWSGDYKKEAVCEELADVMNYCLLLADRIGVDPEEIIRKKLEINRQKYPIEKAKGNAKKYTEF